MLRQNKIQNLDREIDAMAKQFALPASEVSKIVWTEIHHLEGESRVRDFLPLLAIKHVKDELRKQATRISQSSP